MTENVKGWHCENRCGQSRDTIIKFIVSVEWADGINWFFACWYRFTKIKTGQRFIGWAFYVHRIFQNLCKRTCTYQGVRSVSFSENFVYVLNEWFPYNQPCQDVNECNEYIGEDRKGRIV